MLPPGALYGSVALQHQGSVTTKGQVDVPGLGCHLRTCSCLTAVQNWPHPSPGLYGKADPTPSQLLYSGEQAPHTKGLAGEPHPKYLRVEELPTTHLPYSGMNEGRHPHHLQQVGDLALGS